MRLPGEPDNGEQRDVPAGRIFPARRTDDRARQLDETWSMLFESLRGPVDAALAAGLSAGEVAYRLGELVHNYFRTRGVTLTSFELRRIVVELLTNHERGWPTLTAAPSSLVDFADGDPDTRARRHDTDISEQPPSPRRDGALTPQQLASMEEAAADAAAVVFGAAPQAAAPTPAAAAPPVMTAELALKAIAAAWQRRRIANPPPGNRGELARWASKTTGEALADANMSVSDTERARLEQLIVDEAFGLGPIEPLLRDATVTSIMINGPRAVFVERPGGIEAVAGFRDAAQLGSVLERLARFAGAAMSGAAHPVIEGRLPDASRFVIVSPPLAPSGPQCTILRRIAPVATLDELVARDALSAPMAALLSAASRGRLNILVSGRAESGRTTLLSALARAAGTEERIVTVERRPELRLDMANVVSLVAPRSQPEPGPAPDLAMAVEAAACLRPDRLVIDGLGDGAVARLVGLVDGGRDGVLASCTATSPRSALEELARLVAKADLDSNRATARHRLADTFDLVVHLEAFRDGTRRVTHIAEVAGADGEANGGRDLFFYQHDSIRPDGRPKGRFISAGLQPFFLPRLARLGLDKALLDES